MENSEHNIENLCKSLTELLNTQDLNEIKARQQSVINQLEKCNKKTGSCIEISRQYRSKIEVQLSEYNKKLISVKHQMDDIQVRLAKLEK